MHALLIIPLIAAWLPAAVLVPNPEARGDMTIQYMPWVDPTAYVWHAEVSPDLKRWYPFIQDPDGVIDYVPFKPNTFVRLVGEPMQQP